MLYFLIMFLSYTFGIWFKCILNFLNKKSLESLREKCCSVCSPLHFLHWGERHYSKMQKLIHSHSLLSSSFTLALIIYQNGPRRIQPVFHCSNVCLLHEDTAVAVVFLTCINLCVYLISLTSFFTRPESTLHPEWLHVNVSLSWCTCVLNT